MIFEFDSNLYSEKSKRTLKIAIGKGRGFNEAINFIPVRKTKEYELFENGSIPVYFDSANNIQLVKVRSKDLPFLLLHNYVDVAVGSSIWFEEYSIPSLRLFSNMPLMKCRLSIIAPEIMSLKNIRSVCSKYPEITRQYIETNEMNAKVIMMEGCHEVALTLGLSDAIIDIIETGKTIERMKFVELDCIKTVTHGIWLRENDIFLKENLSSVISLDKNIEVV